VKAFVSINMATSIDGKIATKFRGPVKLGSLYDSKRMGEIRAKHDIIINGAGTFRAYPFPLLAGKKAKKSSGPANAIVSSKLAIPKGSAWERAAHVEKWIFCGSEASQKKMQYFRDQGIVVAQSKKRRPTAKEILKILSRAGFNRILLEGGGELNASFMEEGLVDRIYLTFCPIIVGGSEAPTFIEGKGFLKGKFPQFFLKNMKRVKDELYLVYER